MPTAQDVLRMVDEQDLDGMATLFAEDATFVMANHEPLPGRSAILEANAAFFAMVQGVRHEVLRDWAVGPATIVEADVTYVRRDGKEVTVPAVSIWTVGDDGLITDYRVFVDQSPVFA